MNPEPSRAGEEPRRADRLPPELRHISDAFLSVDAEWRITFASEQLVRALGPAGVLGRDLWTLLRDAKETELYSAAMRAMKDRVPAHCELSDAASDRWFEAHAYPAADGVSLFVVEISERRRVAQAVERNEKRLRALVENSSDGIVVADHQGAVIYCGRSILGYNRQEWIGRRALELAHPEDQPRAIADFAALLRTPGASRTAQFRALHRDGSWRWLDVLGTNLLDDPDVRGVVVNYRDITERKEFEDHFRESQKLESLGVLAGGIAHDFNNLLAGILGNATIALESLSRGDPARPLIEEVAAAGSRAANLTRQMLAYSGRGRFVVQPVDLSTLVREMLGLLRSSLPRNVELRQELAVNLPAIEADAGQVQQLVMNFVLNAAEAIESGPGRVEVRTGLLLVDAACAQQLIGGKDIALGPCVCLEVRDTGRGIDGPTMRKIFDPFFSTKATGRGLGLAAAQGIVRGHKGGIWIESAPGKGTTFRALFPASRGAAQPQPERRPERLARDIRTILVVDDERIVRQMAQAGLERRGHRVVTAENGREALDALAANGEISLVLLDLSMPVMSGEECLRKIKAVRPELPVILSSGFNEADAVEGFGGGDLAGFLQKPYTAAALATCVNAALERAGQAAEK